VASKGNVVPLPVILTLRDTGVHVSSTNSSYVLAYVEATVDQILSFGAILEVPYVDPNNSHVRFGGCFDNTGA